MTDRSIAYFAAVVAVLGLCSGQADARGYRAHSMKKVAIQRAKRQVQIRHLEQPRTRAPSEVMRTSMTAAPMKAVPIATAPATMVQRSSQPLSLSQRLGGSRSQRDAVSSIKYRFLRTVVATPSAPHFGFRARDLSAGNASDAAPRLFAFARL